MPRHRATSPLPTLPEETAKITEKWVSKSRARAHHARARIHTTTRGFSYIVYFHIVTKVEIVIITILL